MLMSICWDCINGFPLRCPYIAATSGNNELALKNLNCTYEIINKSDLNAILVLACPQFKKGGSPPRGHRRRNKSRNNKKARKK